MKSCQILRFQGMKSQNLWEDFHEKFWPVCMRFKGQVIDPSDKYFVHYLSFS